MTKRTYVPAIAFAALLAVSFMAARWMEPDPDPGLEQVPIYVLWISLVGAISSVILGWQADRRTVLDQALKITRLENELAALKGHG